MEYMMVPDIFLNYEQIVKRRMQYQYHYNPIKPTH